MLLFATIQILNLRSVVHHMMTVMMIVSNFFRDDYDDNDHEKPEDEQSKTTPTFTSISPTNTSDSHPSLTKKDNAMEHYSRITPEKGKYVIMLIFIFYCTV